MAVPALQGGMVLLSLAVSEVQPVPKAGSMAKQAIHPEGRGNSFLGFMTARPTHACA